MLIKKAADLRYSDITPKPVYFNRRSFLAGIPAAFLAGKEMLSPSARALAAAGHGAAVAFHFAMENRRLDSIANGEAWAAAYASVPERVRHLALHDQHLIAINERDSPFITGALMAKAGLAMNRAGWRERVAMLEKNGATEVAFQPAGPDIARELEAFASAVR